MRKWLARVVAVVTVVAVAAFAVALRMWPGLAGTDAAGTGAAGPDSAARTATGAAAGDPAAAAGSAEAARGESGEGAQARTALAPAGDGVEPPAIAAGSDVVIELTEPAAARYLDVREDDTDAFYRKLVAEESQAVGTRGATVYDPSLGRAAREFVFQYQNLGLDPPSDVRTFLTVSAGAIAGDTVFQHARSQSEAEGALRQAIRAVLESARRGSGVLHVGVGEVYQPGASLSRHIGVVGTRLGIDVEPLDRRVARGQGWRLSGRLRAQWRDLSALLLQPDGALATLEVQVHGERLDVEVPAFDTTGAVELQVIGEGPEGPGKLVQVRVEIGQEPPSRYHAVLPPDESAIRGAADAAAYVWTLVNRDRRAHGVAPLAWDAQLAAIARDHSADMRDNGFFGHVSPTTGLPADRLQRAGYRAATSAENVAHNPTLFEAELGLMHSLGHRRNLLDPQMTHLGVGVAGAEEERGQGSERKWWITQLFAKPMRHWDAAAARAEVHGRLAAQRTRLGLAGLADHPGLNAVAAQALELAVQGKLSDASADALARAQAQHVLPGRLRVWTAVSPDLDATTWPESTRMAAARALGLAVRQREDGQLAIVLLVGEAAP